MEFRRVTDADDSILKAATALHHRTLSYRSFITMFGEKFLLGLYRAMLEDRLGFLVVATAGRELAGFILGCTDSSKLLTVILRRPWRFVPLILPSVLRNPKLAGPLLETLSYAKREDIAVKAELLVIAIDESFRSQGMGSSLVQRLNHEFVKQGIHEYKVTVHKDMIRSNQFYVQNGMRCVKTFKLYNVAWNIYLNRIADGG